MEATMENKKQHHLISKPLFLQALKANWTLWLFLTIGSAAIFIVINVVVCSRNIFTNVNMDKVSVYVIDENLSWLQVLGLLEQMGFNLSRIEVMSRIDLNSIISDLVYKIAGVILPMIFVMITANNLIANQVSSGSMAYVLSTPTSRKKVILTNFLFLISALVAMYLVITVSALLSETIAGAIRKANGGNPNMNVVRTLLLCLSSFSALFALAGVCFGASAFFNKSNNSVAVGGGVCVLSFLCCILGLFGSKVFVSVGIGVEAMNIFNYASLFTLIDTDSISSFSKAVYHQPDAVISFNWIWEVAILLGIGTVGSIIGSVKFLKKDLPL
ncbi:MAG: ABC transporter permease [Bacilli bacterium]|nr:ABC transporter permease [Bacilli bacterium]